MNNSDYIYYPCPEKIVPCEPLFRSLQDGHSLFVISNFYCFLLGLSNDCRYHHMFYLNSCDSALQDQLTASIQAVYKMWNFLSSHFQKFPVCLKNKQMCSGALWTTVAANILISVMIKYIIFFSYFNSFSFFFPTKTYQMKQRRVSYFLSLPSTDFLSSWL